MLRSIPDLIESTGDVDVTFYKRDVDGDYPIKGCVPPTINDYATLPTGRSILVW